MKIQKIKIDGLKAYRYIGYLRDLIRVYKDNQCICQFEVCKDSSEICIKQMIVNSISDELYIDCNIEKVDEKQLLLFLEKGGSNK